MGVGRLRGKAGVSLDPRVPSTRRPQRAGGLGSEHRVQSSASLPSDGLSAQRGAGAAGPTLGLTRGSPGSVEDSRPCAGSPRKFTTSNKSLRLGNRQGSGWPSPPVPGLREECVFWGEMPVSSEQGSASGECVLKGRSG